MIKRRKNSKKIGEPFSHNPFMIGYDSNIFIEDNDLGFIFPNKKVITSGGFLSQDNLIKSLKPSDKIILNMGDSSTSGWDSNKISKGNCNPNSVFFTYKTYSQLLEEQSDFKIINAGVPGYTSLQGLKYLELLLKELAKREIMPSYITVYFGNNDSTYNQIEDKVRLDNKMPTRNSSGYRVSLNDYKKNISEMISVSREYGATPILIAPLINYDWEPGIRAQAFRNEFEEALKKIKNSDIKNKIILAKELYNKGDFKKAKEADLVLPRIKESYLKILFEISKTERISIVDVQKNIPSNDTEKYFADYCHPLEISNQFIVDAILQIIKVNKKKKAIKKEVVMGDLDFPNNTYSLY